MTLNVAEQVETSSPGLVDQWKVGSIFAEGFNTGKVISNPIPSGTFSKLNTDSNWNSKLNS